MLTKPLPLFYAMENLAKAYCVLADATTLAEDFRSHGPKSDQSRRNSIGTLPATVQKAGKGCLV